MRIGAMRQTPNDDKLSAQQLGTLCHPRFMSGLLSLRTELLQEIGAEAADKTLRLVCKRINLALEPQILSGIVLSSPRLSSQVDSLVTTVPKPTSASKYATKLRIRSLCPSPHENGGRPLEEAKIKSFLLPAIGSLVGVRRVIWELGQLDPGWATLLVLDALASLPVLEDLHLCFWWSQDSPVPPHALRLSKLKKLTLYSCCDNRTSIIRTVAELIGRNQLELTSVIIVAAPYGDPPTLQDFLAETSSSVCLKITHLHLEGLFVKFDASALRHLRSLISLTIVNICSPPDETTAYQRHKLLAEKIWSTLRSEKIYLQELVTDDVQPALVEYLTSFSGLRHLRLISTSLYRTPQWVSDQLAIGFYEQGLENHISFLESLQVRSNVNGKWCFGKHCFDVIKKGTRLTFLELSILSEDIPRGEEEVRDDAESLSPPRGNAIWSLLDICATLPILKSLTMRSKHNRGNVANMQREWIAQNLESYSDSAKVLHHVSQLNNLFTTHVVSTLSPSN